VGIVVGVGGTGVGVGWGAAHAVRTIKVRAPRAAAKTRIREFMSNLLVEMRLCEWAANAPGNKNPLAILTRGWTRFVCSPCSSPLSREGFGIMMRRVSWLVWKRNHRLTVAGQRRTLRRAEHRTSPVRPSLSDRVTSSVEYIAFSGAVVQAKGLYACSAARANTRTIHPPALSLRVQCLTNPAEQAADGERLLQKNI
jgi:hypothetical protein